MLGPVVCSQGLYHRYVRRCRRRRRRRRRRRYRRCRASELSSRLLRARHTGIWRRVRVWSLGQVRTPS